MQKTTVKVMMLSVMFASVAVFSTGCSRDEEVAQFAKANDHLVAQMKATKSPEQAKKVYGKEIAKLRPLWSDIKDARSFQISAKSKKKMEKTVMNGLQAVCGLEIRGTFDKSAKKVYGGLCDDYAKMMHISPSLGRDTLMVEQVDVDGFVDDFKGVKKDLANGEAPPLMGCFGLKHDLATAKKYGFDKQAAELTKMCHHDAPLHALKLAVETAEKARAAHPNDHYLNECVDVEEKSAFKTLSKNGFGEQPTVTQLVGRWKKACPKG